MSIKRTAVLFVLCAILLGASTASAQSPITWTATNGPNGGLINALALSPSIPNVIYAGTNGGVYVTRNDGANWQSVSVGLPIEPDVTALAMRDQNLVFAGTHSGVYRTRDAGMTWTLADSHFADQYILCLVIDQKNPNTVYAGTTTTILRSDNNGDDWKDVGASLKSVYVSSLAIATDGQTIYAATNAGLYVSRNQGSTWQANSEGLVADAIPQSVVITPHGLLLGTAQGIYRSKDGIAWSAVSGTASGLARLLVNDPQQPDRVMAITAQGIVKSNDGGGTWSPTTSPVSNVPVLSLVPIQQNVYAGTARGVWKSSDNGANWQDRNNGLASTNVHYLLLTASNPSTLFAATRFGLHRSQDHGTTWSNSRGLTDPNVVSLIADPSNPNTIFAGTWSSSVYWSTDGGANFIQLVENLASNKAPVSSLYIQHPNATSTLVYAGTLGGGLFKSEDGGKKWTLQTNGLTDTARVDTLTLIPPAALYAGTDHGVYRLDNTTATWQSVSAKLALDETRFILYDPRQPQTLFVGLDSSGIFRSDDGGIQWQPLGSDTFPARARLQTLALNPNNASLIYASTDRGMYRSENGGTTWNVVTEGLPAHSVIQTIVIDPQAVDNLYVGTDSHSVMRGNDAAARPGISDWMLGVIGLAAILSVVILGYAGLSWRSRSSVAAQERAWERDWLQWEAAITNALNLTGEANENTLNKLPRRQLARALQRYAREHSDDALALTAAPASLKQENFAITQKFISHWKAAWQVVDSEEAFKSVTGQIVDQLCLILGFTRVEERSYRGLIGYVVKAPSLRLKIPPRFPIVFIPRHQADESDLESLRMLMNVMNMVSYFALIIDLRDTPPTDNRHSLKHLVRAAIHDFIVLDGKDLRELLGARDHARRLVEIILGQVDLTVISPYVTSGPVPPNMFFGREAELKTIVRTVRDTNFAIVGGRKIGKTSVLARVYQQLQDAPEYQPYYLDCQASQSYTDFFEAINTMWKTDLDTRTPEGFRRMATELSKQHLLRTVVLLFDEIDGLLKYDIEHGEHLFRIFRALAQEGPVRFIFCGEKVLNTSLHNPHLVFFNFCNLMPLTYLLPEEARRVVVDPMQEMGITLEGDAKLADQIVTLAAGHPNVVQYLCQKLIERINQRRERIITAADVQAISQSTQFAEYFAEVSWSNASALERLITLLMLDQSEVTVGEMAEAFRARELPVSPEQLTNALDNLTLYSILRRDGPKYTYAAQAFPAVLRRSQDVFGLIVSYTHAIQTGNGVPA